MEPEVSPNKFVQDGPDMSDTDIPKLKEDIYTLYEELANAAGEEPLIYSGKTCYFYHGIKMIKENDTYEVFDCSAQKVVSTVLIGDQLTKITEYIPFTNKYLLWLLLQEITKLKHE